MFQTTVVDIYEIYILCCVGVLCGGARAGAVESQRYKPHGRGFESRRCHWNFSLTSFFRWHCGPRVDSTSYRNDDQEYFVGVKAAGS